MHGKHPRLTVAYLGSIAKRFCAETLLLLVVSGMLAGCATSRGTVERDKPVDDMSATETTVPEMTAPSEKDAMDSVSHTWTPDLFVPESLQRAERLARRLNPVEQHLKSWTELAPALRVSLAHTLLYESEQVAVAHGNVAVTWGEIARTLTRLQELLPRLDKEPDLFASAFRWLRMAEGADFSGYYEPVFKASRTRKPGYTFPLYRLPSDLKQMNLGSFKTEYIGQNLIYRLKNGVPVPYYTREEIDGTPAVPASPGKQRQAARPGVLHGKGLELAWLADPQDAYFLHVQGSGRLRFQDGSEIPVRFAGSNGRPYLSIGKYLSGLGHIPSDTVSMQAIRQWLTEHSEQQNEVLYRNKRYIFFDFPAASKTSRNTLSVGPTGSMGAPITPWVTLAVDKSTLPLGAVVAFDVRVPVATPEPASRPLYGIGLAQDSGEAIRGRRVDLFCGRGEQAAYTAGHLNTLGEVWLLLVR